MKKSTVLVTGAGGFIGANLVERLSDAGHSVVALDMFSRGVPEGILPGVRFEKGDIRSRDIAPLFTDIEYVFHLAAKNSPRECQNDPVSTMEINVVGTANIFNISLKAGVKKVMYASSAVLEEGEDRRRGFYAISKASCELLAEGFAALGLTSVALRYSNVFGAGQDFRRRSPLIMSRFIAAILQGEQPVLFEGDDKNKRDFIHVADINDFHLLCLEDERVNGKMFQLGTGKNHSIVEVLAMVQNILGTNVQPVVKPRMLHDDPVATVADNSDALALGWRPKMGLEEGIRGMVPFIREQINQNS